MENEKYIITTIFCEKCWGKEIIYSDNIIDSEDKYMSGNLERVSKTVDQCDKCAFIRTDSPEIIEFRLNNMCHTDASYLPVLLRQMWVYLINRE